MVYGRMKNLTIIAEFLKENRCCHKTFPHFTLSTDTNAWQINKSWLFLPKLDKLRESFPSEGLCITNTLLFMRKPSKPTRRTVKFSSTLKKAIKIRRLRVSKNFDCQCMPKPSVYGARITTFESTNLVAPRKENQMERIFLLLWSLLARRFQVFLFCFDFHVEPARKDSYQTPTFILWLQLSCLPRRAAGKKRLISSNDRKQLKTAEPELWRRLWNACNEMKKNPTASFLITRARATPEKIQKHFFKFFTALTFIFSFRLSAQI